MKKEELSVEAIANSLTEHKLEPHATKIYKGESNLVKENALSLDIHNKRQMLSASTKNTKVDWNNLDDVKNRVDNYFSACELAKCFPSVGGLAVYGFGVSARALNYYLQKHNNATTDYIYQVKDIIADILANQAVFSNANPVMSIFVLKNSHGWKDTVEISQGDYSPREEHSIEEIIERYREEHDVLDEPEEEL